MSNNFNSEKLPPGWIRTFDSAGNPFYVDTNAKPPRSTWVHPSQDEEYLKTHANPSTHANSGRKRGFFGKLKDKAIGTKEEREAERIRIAQLQEQRRRQRLEAEAAFAEHQRRYPQQQPWQPPYGGYVPQQYGYGQRRGGYALPLLGGIAGGLLLGDVLDGGFGDNDFGDNGFDNSFDGGGDFGGNFN